MVVSYIYLNLRTHKWQIGDKPKSSAAFPQYDAVSLMGVTFRVSAAQRDWCIAHRHPKTGRPYKFVHAFAVGTVVAYDPDVDWDAAVPISYNVERGPFFYRKDTGAAIRHCDYVRFTPLGALAWGVS